jgi:hypothetical protein
MQNWVKLGVRAQINGGGAYEEGRRRKGESIASKVQIRHVIAQQESRLKRARDKNSLKLIEIGAMSLTTTLGVNEIHGQYET